MNTDTKKILKIISLSAFLLFIIIFTFYQSKNLIFGVKINDVKIVSNDLAVETGEKVLNNIIKISGNAKNASNLTLDGRVISINQEGNFNETMALLSGYNIITIKAEDKFGNKDEKNYKLMY